MTKTLSAILFVIIILSGCRKNQADFQSTRDSDLVQEAKKYFTEVSKNLPNNVGNQRLKSVKSEIWDKAVVIDIHKGQGVLVPLKYNQHLYLKSTGGGSRLSDGENVSKLLIYKDSTNKFTSEFITVLPDSNFQKGPQGKFTGMLLREDLAGNLITEYKYNKSNIQVYNPRLVKQQSISTNSVKAQNVIMVCYEITGYNYSDGDPDGGYSWTEDAGCDAIMTVDDLYDAGGAGGYGDIATALAGGGGPSPAASYKIINGDAPISDIGQYNHCFTNSGAADHKYTVTICVAQPSPGSRETWSWAGGGSSATGNPVNVGHTFLIFGETYGNTTIIRNIGFYPLDDVSPYSPTDQGQLNNDQNHAYNISMVFNVSDFQFFEILNYTALGNNVGFAYDLNINNCTTFALNSLAAGGITLPRTTGTWTGGGSGNDPGDLGEDLRNMYLPVNGSRSTIEGTHLNAGFCH